MRDYLASAMLRLAKWLTETAVECHGSEQPTPAPGLCLRRVTLCSHAVNSADLSTCVCYSDVDRNCVSAAATGDESFDALTATSTSCFDT